MNKISYDLNHPEGMRVTCWKFTLEKNVNEISQSNELLWRFVR